MNKNIKNGVIINVLKNCNFDLMREIMIKPDEKAKAEEQMILVKALFNDNEANYDIVSRSLVVSSITASLKIDGALSDDLNEFQIKLVP